MEWKRRVDFNVASIEAGVLAAAQGAYNLAGKLGAYLRNEPAATQFTDI